jgi:hypothetical protein
LLPFLYFNNTHERVYLHLDLTRNTNKRANV